MFEPVYFCLSN